MQLIDYTSSGAMASGDEIFLPPATEPYEGDKPWSDWPVDFDFTSGIGVVRKAAQAGKAVGESSESWKETIGQWASNGVFVALGIAVLIIALLNIDAVQKVATKAVTRGIK